MKFYQVKEEPMEVAKVGSKAANHDEIDWIENGSGIKEELRVTKDSSPKNGKQKKSFEQVEDHSSFVWIKEEPIIKVEALDERADRPEHFSSINKDGEEKADGEHSRRALEVCSWYQCDQCLIVHGNEEERRTCSESHGNSLENLRTPEPGPSFEGMVRDYSPSQDSTMQDSMDTTVSEEVGKHTHESSSLPVTEDSRDSWGKGGRRSEIWTSEQTENLIHLVRKNYSRFTGPKALQGMVWHEITMAIQELLPEITMKQVQAKWRNLKHSYVRYEENKKAIGRGAKKPPPHFHELASFLREKLAVQPIDYEEEELDDDNSFTESSHTLPASVHQLATPETPRTASAVDIPAATPGIPSADSEARARNITGSCGRSLPLVRSRHRTRPLTVRESLDKTIKRLTDRIGNFIDFETQVELRREEREKELYELDRVLKLEQIRILQLKRREMEIALEEH